MNNLIILRIKLGNHNEFRFTIDLPDTNLPKCIGNHWYQLTETSFIQMRDDIENSMNYEKLDNNLFSGSFTDSEFTQYFIYGRK